VTNGAIITTTDYAGNYIYQNNALQMINQPEGYLEPNGQGGYDYGYQLKDHLGNIRLTFVDYDNNGSIALTEITEENNYYPFGLKHQGYNNIVNSNTNAVASKFKYNGKELNDELGLDWYDYGVRFYNAALGRWHTLDPLLELYKSWSPYNYAVNSPIRFLDPNGMSVADQFWNNIIEDSDVERSGSENWNEGMQKNVEEKEKEKEKATDVKGSPLKGFSIDFAISFGLTNIGMRNGVTISFLKTEDDFGVTFTVLANGDGYDISFLGVNVLKGFRPDGLDMKISDTYGPGNVTNVSGWVVGASQSSNNGYPKTSSIDVKSLGYQYGAPLGASTYDTFTWGITFKEIKSIFSD
jgi:RHS repeat-associated protein